MKKDYRSFQIFHQKEQAEEISSIFKEKNIDAFLKVHPPGFNAIFGTTSNYEAELFVKNEHYSEASSALSKLYNEEAKSVDKDHYLYAFSDEELYEVVYHHTEWSELDVIIAEEILKERGVSDYEALKQALEHNNPLKYNTPTKNKTWLVIVGYIGAILFTVFGMCLGIFLFTRKHKLPDGKEVYKYSKSDQMHGKIIAAIGLGVFLANLYFKTVNVWSYILN